MTICGMAYNYNYIIGAGWHKCYGDWKASLVPIVVIHDLLMQQSAQVYRYHIFPTRTILKCIFLFALV